MLGFILIFYCLVDLLLLKNDGKFFMILLKDDSDYFYLFYIKF